MTKPSTSVESLRARLRGAAGVNGLFLWDVDRNAGLSSLLNGTYLGGQLGALSGRSVLIATRNQLATALALIELDGVARRFVICPADVPAEHLPSIIANADVDGIVSDRPTPGIIGQIAGPCVEPLLQPVAIEREPDASHETEWVLLTSGTTGAPKLVVHSLRGLTGAFRGRAQPSAGVIWATFYDIRRYGGLQIFLRAMTGPTSLVLSNPDETPSDHLQRLAARGVTHISGTPTHWRRAIMNPAAKLFQPQYVRLSGEIADQAILDGLQTFWPHARVGHAYASTEAGVGFEVVDGREGFPASLLGAPRGELEMKIEDGSLRIRSTGAASRYLGERAAEIASGDGFVDTGDMIECSADRCYFRGRRGGIINVGGSKVHPEEVEAVINGHPRVRMSLVSSQKSPFTGAIVVAEVVLNPLVCGQAASAAVEQTQQEILELCRQRLARYKVPALMRFVPSLNVTGAGKLARGHA
jgi:acyl-coenzyme A synthetase/AMP-(fatty) acid ligase